jgi:hypothetical protein
MTGSRLSEMIAIGRVSTIPTTLIALRADRPRPFSAMIAGVKRLGNLWHDEVIAISL